MRIKITAPDSKAFEAVLKLVESRPILLKNTKRCYIVIEKDIIKDIEWRLKSLGCIFTIGQQQETCK